MSTKAKTLMEVADEAMKEVETQDFTTLEEHDRRYHDNQYRGGKCLVREAMASGDKSDRVLNDEEEREAALYVANRQERKMVEDAVMEAVPAINAQNSRVMLSEADKDGVSRLMIWSKADKVKDEDVPKELLEKTMKGLGYTTNGYSIMVEKAEDIRRSKGRETDYRSKDKKCFVMDVTKKSAIKLAEKDTAAQQVGYVHHQESQGDLDDERKSAALKKYGLKCVNGKIVKMTPEDVRRERARRYLGIVGDLEGQSNREDVKSGEWEKRRLAALKREQEAKKEALAGV